eukprot:3954273-Pyramimonas_sp.AAC.1
MAKRPRPALALRRFGVCFGFQIRSIAAGRQSCRPGPRRPHPKGGSPRDPEDSGGTTSAGDGDPRTEDRILKRRRHPATTGKGT